MTIKNIMVNQYPKPKDLTSAFDIVKAIVYEYDGHDEDTKEEVIRLSNRTKEQRARKLKFKEKYSN